MDFRKHLETSEQSAAQIENFKKAHTKNLFGVCKSFIIKKKKLESDILKDVYNFGKLLATQASYEEFDKVKTDLSKYLLKVAPHIWRENELEIEVSRILMDILTKMNKG